MPIQSVGSAVGQNLVFNSGKLTIGSSLMVDVQDITINNAFTEKTFRALNSIKKRAIRRASLEQSVKCTIKGPMTDIYSLFFSSSSPISGGNEYEALDGQQLATTVYITCYKDDDATKAYQFQLQNATFMANNWTAPVEDYLSVEVDITCTEIKLDVHTTAEN